MEYRRLGRTGTKVSVICFGGGRIGEGVPGAGSYREAAQSLEKAHALGVNFIDTADYYGNGRSEEIIGGWMRDRRSAVVVATKGGVIAGARGEIGFNATPGYLKQAVHKSLARLKTDYIDLYQLHHPDPNIPLEESIGALAGIQSEGLIRHIGVSNFTLEQLARAMAVARIVSIQSSFNMFNREIEEGITEYCQSHDVAILSYSPLARGLLCGGYTLETKIANDRAHDAAFQGDLYRFNVEAVEGLKSIAARHQMGILPLVLSWSLARPGMTSLITGVRNAGQIDEICGSDRRPLSSDIELEIEAVLQERIGKIKRKYWYFEVAKFFLRNRPFRQRLYSAYRRFRKI